MEGAGKKNEIEKNDLFALESWYLQFHLRGSARARALGPPPFAPFLSK